MMRFNDHSRQRVRRMRRNGVSWEAIGATFGVSRDTVRKAFDPEYHERQLEKERKRRRELYRGITRNRVKTDHIDRFMRVAEPDDTRDYTARFFGDPLPERSALAQKRREGFEHISAPLGRVLTKIARSEPLEGEH